MAIAAVGLGFGTDEPGDGNDIRGTLQDLLADHRVSKDAEELALKDQIRRAFWNWTISNGIASLQGVASGMIFKVSKGSIQPQQSQNWADDDPRNITSLCEGMLLSKVVFYIAAKDDLDALMMKKTGQLAGIVFANEPEGNLEEKNPALAVQIEDAWKTAQRQSIASPNRVVPPPTAVATPRRGWNQ